MKDSGISPMDKKLLEMGDVYTAEKHKTLLYEQTPTGSLDVLVLDYFEYVIAYLHVCPNGYVDFQAKIEPRTSIHREPLLDLIRSIRIEWQELMMKDAKYAPTSAEDAGISSRKLREKIPVIRLDVDEE